MIHIVFNEPDVAVLQQAIELDENLQGDVILIKDDYAVGPLDNIYSAEGIEKRYNWWKEILSNSEFAILTEERKVNDPLVVEGLLQRMSENPEEIIWIWAAQNKHDVSGYYWLMSQLKELQGRVFILYLNNLPFINEKGNIFYPDWLSQIQPKEFLKAKKLARPITLSEFEVDPDEWTKICQEQKGVRILEGGKKLVQYDFDFYDADLKKFVGNDWLKGSKIITQFLHKNKQTTGDAYLLWRLKELVALGEFDMQGELKAMRDFELKSKSSVTLAAGQ
ncbi:MAG: DUF1835 domain-containing protein [Chitinophagaceae bacterium]